jgi:hypothetical protein
MLAEARQALHALRCCATQAAGPDGVRRVVGRRLVTYPQARMPEEQWAAWWQDFYDACADLSEAALEAGMAAWVRNPTSQFMPKPGQLRELAQATPNRAVRAYTRITDAVRQAQIPPMHVVEPGYVPPEAPPRPSKEEVAKLMANFRAKMAEVSPANTKPAIPPCHGPTDESGLTAHMRSRMMEGRRA